jgi:hypothetical protein
MVIKMDAKTIREYFYKRLSGEYIEFTKIDGKMYGGYLENWLEDGTLLIDRLILYDNEGERINEVPDWTLVNFDQIAFIYVHEIPDELVNKRLAVRREEQERVAFEKQEIRQEAREDYFKQS